MVVGAGLSGLAAAVELTRAGLDVCVLEARSGLGGRVSTLRDGCGHWWEAGAERIPANHHLVGEACFRAGIPLSPLADSSPDSRRRPQIGSSRLALWGMDIGRRATCPSLLANWLDTVRHVDWNAPLPSDLRRFDEMDFLSFAESVGLSLDHVRGLRRGSCDTHGTVTSALWVLRDASQASLDGPLLLAGLPLRRLAMVFAGQLVRPPFTATRVSSLECRQTEVRVVAVSEGTQHEFRARRVVCAVPPTVLHRIRFDPPLEASRTDVLSRVQYSRGTKVRLAFRRPIWREAGWNGRAWTDDPAEVWARPEIQGQSWALHVYLKGRASEAVSGNPSGAVEFALSIVRRLVPAAAGALVAGAVKTWEDDEWSQGAFFQPRPGGLNEVPLLACPSGPIHFAGEHLDPWNGWMNGAVRSGRSAARGVLTSLERPQNDHGGTDSPRH